jgi:putative ABC transport system permease protein
MWQNYLKVAFRNLWRNRLYVFINVFGLALAVATCVLAYLNDRYERDFNKFHQNYAQIYKINGIRELENSEEGISISPLPLANLLKTSDLEIDQVVRLTRRGVQFKVGNEFFKESLLYADQDFLTMFTFPLKWGEKSTFKQKNTIFLTEEVAEKLFGTRNPLGKTLELQINGTRQSLTIGGVFAKIPKNSSLVLRSVTVFDNFFAHQPALKPNDWEVWLQGTFVMAKSSKAVTALEKQLQQLVSIQNKNCKSLKIKRFQVEKLANMAVSEHNLYGSAFDGGLADSAILGISSSSILMLLLACFNFINTSIAFAGNRLKEIGIRKTVGGTRQQLIIQFMFEHFLLLGGAVLLGLCLAEVLLPAYNSLFPFLYLELNYFDSGALWLFLIGLWLLMGFLAGIYPAFYLSAFNPVSVLRKKVKFGGVSHFTQVLLVLQLAITVYQLTFSISFYQNTRYQETLDKGYDFRQVLVVPIKNAEKLTVFKNSIQQNPQIEQVASAKSQIGLYLKDLVINHQGKDFPVGLLEVGNDYTRAMGLKIVAGEDLHQVKVTDNQRVVLVNQKFVATMGWQNPIGQMLKIDSAQVRVVGVIKDFHEKTVLKGEKIRPVLLKLSPQSQYLAIRTAPEKLASVNLYLKNTWQNLFPDEPYEGFYQEDALGHFKFVNGIILTVNGYFTFFALLIALLSLHTLLSLTILRKLKEIGIRKVFGANMGDIAWLVTRNYAGLLGLASILGVLAGYFMLEFLLDIIYDYRIPLGFWHFALPILAIYSMAILTIGFKVYFTALLNPVDVLKNE